MPSVGFSHGLGRSSASPTALPRQTRRSTIVPTACFGTSHAVSSPLKHTDATRHGPKASSMQQGRVMSQGKQSCAHHAVASLALTTIATCLLSTYTQATPAKAAEANQAAAAGASQTQVQQQSSSVNATPGAKIRGWLNSYFQSLTAPSTTSSSPTSSGATAPSSTPSSPENSGTGGGDAAGGVNGSTSSVVNSSSSSSNSTNAVLPSQIAPAGNTSADDQVSAAFSSQQASALSTLLSESEALQLPALPTAFPELPTLAPLQIRQAQLSNGLRVIMVEDHEVPLVQGSILMKGGTQASPSDKVGLASLSVAVQRAGGSITHPGPQMDLLLEELGAYVEAGAGSQVMSVDFFSSKEDLPQVLALWAEVLREPALPQDRLAFYQDQVLNALEHKDDNPGATARRELAKLLYGPTSIYARQPTKASVTSITTDDVKKFLNYWERPDAAVLGVVGDFQADELMKLLEDTVGGWQPAAGQPVTPPAGICEPDILAAAAQSAGKVFLVDRPGLAQAAVAVGEPGVSLQDPDAYSLDVLSLIFNSFGGTLFDEIRSREGLAYSVYGAWDIPPDRAGVFVGGGETSAPGEFIQGLRRVLGDATKAAPPVTILEDARSQALNTWVFNFVSKSNQLQRRLVYELLGLPVDLVFRYRDAVMRVTADDVLGAAQRHLHPEQQVTVMVADAAQVTPQLKAVGLVPIPLTASDD